MSQIAPKVLDSETVLSRLVAEIRAALQGVAKGNQLNRFWIPGHTVWKEKTRLRNKGSSRLTSKSKKLAR